MENGKTIFKKKTKIENGKTLKRKKTRKKRKIGGTNKKIYRSNHESPGKVTL